MLIYRLNNSHVHPPTESSNVNKTLRMCQNLYKCLGGGGGCMESSNPATVLKGLEKYLNMIKRRCYWKHRTQMNIKNRKLGLTEINLWQRITCCVSPFPWNSTTEELTCARRHQSSGCFAKGEDDKGTFFTLRECFPKQLGLCTWGLYLSGWNNLLGAMRLIGFACVERNK